MKQLRWLFLLPVICLAACDTSEVISDYDPVADFTAYKTFSVCVDDFQVISPGHAAYDSPKMKEYFKEAIEKELKEYYSVNDQLPDLKAGIEISIQDKKMVYRSCEKSDDYSKWPECSMQTLEYSEGSVQLFVADRSRNQVIWQARMTGYVSEDLAENRKVILRIVHELFREFPGQQTGKTMHSNL